MEVCTRRFTTTSPRRTRGQTGTVPQERRAPHLSVSADTDYVCHRCHSARPQLNVKRRALYSPVVRSCRLYVRSRSGSAPYFLPAVEQRRTQSDCRAAGTDVIVYSYPLPTRASLSRFRNSGNVETASRIGREVLSPPDQIASRLRNNRCGKLTTPTPHRQCSDSSCCLALTAQPCRRSQPFYCRVITRLRCIGGLIMLENIVDLFAYEVTDRV